MAQDERVAVAEGVPPAMRRVGVIGAGTMGHGIAQVCAMAVLDVVLADADGAALERAIRTVTANLETGIARGKVTPDVRDATLARLKTGDTAAAATGADLVIEAVPERLDLKRQLFAEVERHAPAACVFG